MNEPIPEFVDVARWIPLIEPIPDKTCVMPSLSKQPVRLVGLRSINHRRSYDSVT